LASEARQAVGETLVGKYGWEVWVCGQPGRFARLSTYPHRPPTYPSSSKPRIVERRLFGISNWTWAWLCCGKIRL